MSTVQSRPPRPPFPDWDRPPTGVWPPCPPGPPGPWPGGLFRLEQCWDDVKATRAFLTRIIKDILADDPSIIGLAQPIIGVTDGSEAQPGQVGEYIEARTAPGYVLPAGVWQPTVSLLLPAGDWDIGGEVDMNPDTPAMQCTSRISLDAVGTAPSTLTGAMLSTVSSQITHWGGNAGGDLVQRTSQPTFFFGWAYCDVQVSSFYFALSGRRRR